MGKSARIIPRGKFVLRTQKNSGPDTFCPVYLYYYCGGKQLRLHTGIATRLKDWNQKSNNGVGQLRASYGSKYKEKNAYLEKLLSKTDDGIIKCIDKKIRITPYVLKAIMKDDVNLFREDKGTLFLTYAKDSFKKKYDEHEISISTYKNHVSNINQFEIFWREELQKKDPFIGDITKENIIQFLNWKFKSGRCPETVNKYLQTLATVCKKAKEEELLDKNVSNTIEELSFVDHSFDIEELDVKYLTEEEMKRLSLLDKISLTSRQAEVLEMFVFSFQACGLRISDIISLRWKDVNYEKRTIKKILIKTRKRNTIPLNDSAKKILSNWEGINSTFVFNLLPENFDLNDDKEFRKRRNSITSSFNRILEKISRIAELDKKVTFHYSRHTFSVLALSKGLDVGVISRLLGHSSTAITEKVYSEYLPDDLSKTVDNLNLIS